MAEKIATYQLKEAAIRPSNAGYEAAEMAGRRIGPFAEQAARAITQVANLTAESDKARGQVEAEFLRFQAYEDKAGQGGGVKYGGGLKDMFQLGGGGQEPNYARLNRLSELQDGPVAISRAARRMVDAQSPLTHGLTPSQAWEREQSGQGLTDQQRQMFEASGFGKKQQREISTGYAQGYGGKDDFEKNPNGDYSTEGLSKEAAGTAAAGDAATYLRNTYGINSDAGGGPMTGNAPPETSSGGYGGYDNSSPFSNFLSNLGSAAANPQGIPQIGDNGVNTPAPTASSTSPTTSYQPVPNAPTTPADSGADTAGFWGSLWSGMSPGDNSSTGGI